MPSVAQWTDHVVALGTFSKLVVPGLRVGWMVAPPWLRPMLVRAKQGADLHTSSWGQALLAEIVTEKSWLADHTEAQAHAERTLGSTATSAAPTSPPSGPSREPTSSSGGTDG